MGKRLSGLLQGISLPDEPRSGQPVKAETIAQILRVCVFLMNEIRAVAVNGSSGIGIKRSSSGTTLQLLSAGGRGGGESGPIVPPLNLVTTRPNYISAVSVGPDEGFRRYYVTWGGCNGFLPMNWNQVWDVSLSSSKYFWAKINFAAGDNLSVKNWEIISGDSLTDYENTSWLSGAARPAAYYHPLGQVLADGKVFNTGGGSLLVTEYAADITAGPVAGTAAYRKVLFVQREGY